MCNLHHHCYVITYTHLSCSSTIMAISTLNGTSMVICCSSPIMSSDSFTNGAPIRCTDPEVFCMVMVGLTKNDDERLSRMVSPVRELHERVKLVLLWNDYWRVVYRRQFAWRQNPFRGLMPSHIDGGLRLRVKLEKQILCRRRSATWR